MGSIKFITFFVTILVLIQSFVSGNVRDYKPYSYDTPSVDGLYSYFIKLEVPQIDGSMEMCAGALLTNQWIVTSCKWLKNAINVTAILGNDAADGYSLNIDENDIIDASNGLYQDDVSIQLIRLPFRIKYTKTIQRIDLPSDCSLTSDEKIFLVGCDFSRVIGENARNLVSTTTNIVAMSECPENSWTESNKFSYCVGVGGAEKVQRGRLLIQPQGRLLIGFLSGYGSSDNENYSGSKVTFRYIMEYSQIIANVTGLRLPNCEPSILG